jgi:hypothetical protein
VTPEVLIPNELVAFIESGLSIVAATRDGDLEPDGAAGLAVQVHEDRAGLTAFFYHEAAAQLLRNLKSHPQIALDLDLPTTHRACQVKGHYVSSRPALESERPEIERQVHAFVADLRAIGVPPAMMAGWKGWPCTAIEVRVTELFEQTPGPGAGEPLK